MAGLTTAVAILAGGAIAGGTSVAAAKMSSNAAKRAGQQSAASIDQQIAFEREQAEEDKRRFEETQRFNREIYERERAEDLRRRNEDRALEMARWDAEQARRAPYRKASVENMNQLAAQTAGTSLADLASATRRR